MVGANPPDVVLGFVGAGPDEVVGFVGPLVVGAVVLGVVARGVVVVGEVVAEFGTVVVGAIVVVVVVVVVGAGAPAMTKLGPNSEVRRSFTLVMVAVLSLIHISEPTRPY